MTAPPPDDPDGPRDPRERSDLDFDAEFERIVADFGPSPVEPVETASDEPSDASDEPVETTDPSVGPGKTDESLRDLFRGAWPDEPSSSSVEPHSSSVEPVETPEEHYVPPPAPPLPRPEPRRLLAWAGLIGAPLVGLLLLVLGSLPSFASFLLFCWFVGGFGYLVATMNDGGGDGWDDGAQV